MASLLLETGLAHFGFQVTELFLLEEKNIFIFLLSSFSNMSIVMLRYEKLVHWLLEDEVQDPFSSIALPTSANRVWHTFLGDYRRLRARVV